MRRSGAFVEERGQTDDAELPRPRKKKEKILLLTLTHTPTHEFRRSRKPKQISHTQLNIKRRALRRYSSLQRKKKRANDEYRYKMLANEGRSLRNATPCRCVIFVLL